MKKMRLFLIGLAVILGFAVLFPGTAVAQDEASGGMLIWADPLHDAINGWNWGVGDAITIQVFEPDGTELAISTPTLIYDEAWGAAWNLRADGIDLRGGSRVVMNDGTNYKVLVLTPLEVQVFNFTEVRLEGIYDPAQPFNINFFGTDLLALEFTDDRWAANFAAMPFGSGGEVWQTDPEGDMTGIGFWIPRPRLTVSITDDWFRAEEFPADAEVQVTIYESLGGPVLWSEGRTTDAGGFFFAADWDFNLDLAPGMVVEVAHPTVTKSIVLEPLTLYVLDLDADYLAGSAPAGRSLWVGTGNDQYGCSAEVTASPEGFWEAFMGPCDVTGDMWAAVQVFDEDGDASEANPGFPRGSHDYDAGDVPTWACNVGGWVFDPDDRTRPVDIQVRSDGEVVYTQTVTPYSFEFYLWGVISSYEAHELLVEVYDVESSAWLPLENTPRTLTCRTYDIYTFDPLTGITTQLTDLRETGEFNAAWSPNGKQVVYDVYPCGDGQCLWTTDLRTGESGPVPGGENGNDAVFSPNGRWIAFDRWDEDGARIYITPADGGAIIPVSTDAISPDWSPSGRRLVFTNPFDLTLRTIPVFDGAGEETIVADYGLNPSWSPDGRWIAYDRDGQIWKVEVNAVGKVLSEPVQVTSNPYAKGQPTWSLDSTRIIFHAGMDRDYDLWSIGVDGSNLTWLTGGWEFGDYDPAGAKNSNLVAYSSFTPEGQAPRQWTLDFHYDFPAGPWTEGPHFYEFILNGGDPLRRDFDASFGEPLYPGFAVLRPFQIRAFSEEAGGCTSLFALHPDQPSRFQIGYVEGPMTYAEAVAVYAGLNVTISWDGSEAVPMERDFILPFRQDVRSDLVCSFTVP